MEGRKEGRNAIFQPVKGKAFGMDAEQEEALVQLKEELSASHSRAI